MKWIAQDDVQMNVWMIKLGGTVEVGLKSPCYVLLHVLRRVACRRSIVAVGPSSFTPRPHTLPSSFVGHTPAHMPGCPHFKPRARPSLLRCPHAQPSSYAGHVPVMPGCPCLHATCAHPLCHTLAVLVCRPRARPSLTPCPAVPHTPEQEDDDTTQQQVDAINERSLIIKPEVEHTVRWRWVKGP